MNNMMILADELTSEVMQSLGWSFDTERDTLVDKDNEPIGWEQSDSILIAEPISYDGTEYQQINVWGDGTLEFQENTDGYSYNWNDFDEEFIQKMYDAVMVYQEQHNI